MFALSLKLISNVNVKGCHFIKPDVLVKHFISTSIAVLKNDRM